jgi:hypothetical protein
MGIKQDKNTVEPDFVSFNAAGRFRLFRNRQIIRDKFVVEQENHEQQFVAIVHMHDFIFIAFNKFRAYKVDIMEEKITLLDTFPNLMDSITKLSSKHVVFRCKRQNQESFSLYDIELMKQIDYKYFTLSRGKITLHMISPSVDHSRVT